MTKVNFQKIQDTGEIIAIFPEIYWDNNGNFTCYKHIGQHSACSSSWVADMCIQAKPKQYDNLLDELISIGYDDLEIIR